MVGFTNFYVLGLKIDFMGVVSGKTLRGIKSLVI